MLQERMGSSIDRLQNRVEKALSLLRGSGQMEFPLEMTRVNLIDLCEVVMNRLRPFLQPRGIEVVLRAEGSGIEGMWDREKIEEIVEELLINAARASQDGAQIEVRIFKEHDRVQLEVADEGVGVPTDQLERVFEPFVTLGNANHHKSGWVEFGAGGIGIGLSTVRRWAELHGGTISARLNDGGPGTVFYLQWPIDIDHTSSESLAQADQP